MSDSDEELKRAEERLRLALDSVGDGSWDWNLRTDEIFFSERWCESLGYTRAELGADLDVWPKLVHPEDLELVQDAMAAHREGHTAIFDCEYRLKAKTGDYKWVLGRGRILERDASGEPLRMVGTNTDISLAKRVQETLDSIEGRSRLIVNTAGCIIVVLDADYCIREWNPAAERIYGWSLDEVRGRDYIDWFLPEAYREPVRGEIDRMLGGGADAYNFENPIITRDGTERDVLWNATRLETGSGTPWGIVAIGQDITERNIAERRRRIAEREKLVLSERLRRLEGADDEDETGSDGPADETEPGF